MTSVPFLLKRVGFAVKERLVEAFEPTGLGPQPFAEHHAAEVKRWVAFMTETGMRK